MQFLVILKRTESATANRPEQELNLEKVGIEQFKNDSRTVQLFGLGASSRGCCTIVNVDSAEQLSDYINLNPLSMVCNWEAHPLTSSEQHVSILDKMLQHREMFKKAA